MHQSDMKMLHIVSQLERVQRLISYTLSYCITALSPAVDCGPLMNPANGTVDITQGTTFNQVATYNCDTGYGLVGNMTRTCQADGTWSGSEPICGKFM